MRKSSGDVQKSFFVLTPKQQIKQLQFFFQQVRIELGWVRTFVVGIVTMARFLSLRVRLGLTPSGMVDDAVCFSIALYRSLKLFHSPDDARSIIERCVVTSGIKLTQDAMPKNETYTIPYIASLIKLMMGDGEERKIYHVEDMVDTDTGISWDMHYCRYADLAKRFGEPELATIFCAVDVPFFSQVLPEIGFSCETKIASGDDTCRFRIGSSAESEVPVTIVTKT